VAVPVGFAVFVHLRRRSGALVLATARVSRNPAGTVHAGNAAPGIFHGQVLRTEVHGVLRAAGGNSRQLARSTNAETKANGAGSRSADARAGANRRVARRHLGLKIEVPRFGLALASALTSNRLESRFDRVFYNLSRDMTI
jgi:hypothetical protein